MLYGEADAQALQKAQVSFAGRETQAAYSVAQAWQFIEVQYQSKVLGGH